MEIKIENLNLKLENVAQKYLSDKLNRERWSYFT